MPEGYFAEPNVQFGIEIDVAMFDGNGHAPSIRSWTPPAPTLRSSYPVSESLPTTVRKVLNVIKLPAVD